MKKAHVVQGNWTDSHCTLQQLQRLRSCQPECGNSRQLCSVSAATRPRIVTIWLKIWPVSEQQQQEEEEVVEEEAEEEKETGKRRVSRRKRQSTERRVRNDKCGRVGARGGEKLQVVCPGCSFHAWAAAVEACFQSADLTPCREN